MKTAKMLCLLVRPMCLAAVLMMALVSQFIWGTTGAAAEGSIVPHIEASPAKDWVHARDWPNGAVLTLTIDDPSNGVGVDQTVSDTAGLLFPDDPNKTIAAFELDGFDIKPGFILSVTDGTSEQSYALTDLDVTGLDIDVDTISGVGQAGVALQVCVSGVGACIPRYLIPDAEGRWVADYAHPGTLSDEQILNLRANDQGWAAQSDSNGNLTWADWKIPNAHIEVNLEEQMIFACGWPEDATVTLTVDDPANGVGVDQTFTTTMFAIDSPIDPEVRQVISAVRMMFLDDSSNVSIGVFDLGDFALEAGQILSVTDGITRRTYIPSEIKITQVNLAEDTIFGDAASGVEVQVCVETPDGCAWRFVASDSEGNWVADFANPGPRDDEKVLVNLQAGNGGFAAVCSPSGDCAKSDWSVLNPYIEANPGKNWIHVLDWPGSVEVTLTIDDPANGVGADLILVTDVGPAPWDPDVNAAVFDLGGEFDLLPGQLLAITDGVTERLYTPTNLTATAFDIDADTMLGVGAPDTEVQVCVNLGDTCFVRYVTSDGDGNWVVDYAHPASPEDESDILDLKSGDSGFATQCDDGVNCTRADWRVPNPHIEADPGQNWVRAIDWPAGATVTLNIDDPITGDGVDTTVVATVEPSSDGPNTTAAEFDLADFVLQAGQLLDVTDGVIERSYTLTDLAVTAFDAGADTISGVGAPGVEVQVCAKTGDLCAPRYVTPDDSGLWMADFANPGGRDDEQATLDLQSGDMGWAIQRDTFGNQTWADWSIPVPRIEVNVTNGWARAYDWPADASLTIILNGDEVYSGPQVDGMVELSFPDGIQADDVLEVSGGGIAKSYTVASVGVETIDVGADAIYGVASPGAMVDVYVNAPEVVVVRHVVAEDSGTWMADFANPGFGDDEQDIADLQAGSEGEVKEYGEFGDQTILEWKMVAVTVTGSVGVGGVTLTAVTAPDGIEITTTSNAKGSYTLTLPYKWSGTITPSKAGYTFMPASKTYANLAADKVLNFVAATTQSFASVAAQDGWILEASENSNSGGSLNTAAVTFQLGDDVANRQYRVILSFDTSSLPDDAIVKSAQLKIMQNKAPVGTNPFSILGNLLVDIRQGFFGTLPGLQLIDFNAPASAVKVGVFNKTPVGGWYTCSLSALGLGKFNKTGSTQFRLYFATDDNNNRLADYMKFVSGNGAANKPQLVITYTVP